MSTAPSASGTNTDAMKEFVIGWGDWVRLFDPLSQYKGVDWDLALALYRRNKVSAVGICANGACGIAMEDINDRAKVEAFVQANAKKGIIVAEVVVDYGSFGLQNFCIAKATPEELQQALEIVDKHLTFIALLQEFQGTVIVLRVDDLIPAGVTLDGIDEETAFGRIIGFFTDVAKSGKAKGVRIAWEVEPAGVTRTATQLDRVCQEVTNEVGVDWFGWEADGSHLGNIAIGVNKPVYGDPEPLGTKDDIAAAIHKLLDRCGKWIIHFHLCGCDGGLHGEHGEHGATSNHPTIAKGLVTMEEWKGIFKRIFPKLQHLTCLMIDLCFFPDAHEFVGECYQDYTVLLAEVDSAPVVLPTAA